MLNQHKQFWKKLLCNLQISPGEQQVEKSRKELDILYADYGGYVPFVESCLKILLESIKQDDYEPSVDTPILNELIQTGELPEEYRVKFAEIVELYPETLPKSVAIWLGKFLTIQNGTASYFLVVPFL